MGLAPYGDPKYVDLILEKLMKIHEDGSVWLDLDYFDYCYGDAMTSELFHELFGGPPRREDELITQREMDLAASVQVVCEDRGAALRATRARSHRCQEPRDGRRRGAQLRGERPRRA